jgi:hypothetical protein
LVARRALGPLPLLFVLVALKAAGHRRKRGLAGLDHSGVASHALSADGRQRQMSVVIDGNLAVRAFGRSLQAGQQLG